MQEILSQEAVDSFQISVLRNRYSTIPFHDGYDSDNHIFFRDNEIEFVSDNYIKTSLRDIAEYVLVTKTTGDTFRIYSAHLKASAGTDNEQKRLEECSILVDYLSGIPEKSDYLLVGDMNFYDSDEPGYQKLLEVFFDPMNPDGSDEDNWHNNENFAYLHTQSPRVEQFGGGASGGVDDRFDFILLSNEITHKMVENSYTAFLNDGKHFNLSINDGRDSPLADALYYASDHLPVFIILYFEEVTGVKDETLPVPETFYVGNNYPNPFNPVTRIPFYLDIGGRVNLTIYTVEGKIIQNTNMDVSSFGEKFFEVDLSGYASGPYYYVLKFGNVRIPGKMLYQK